MTTLALVCLLSSLFCNVYLQETFVVCAFDGVLLYSLLAYAFLTIASLCNELFYLPFFLKFEHLSLSGELPDLLLQRDAIVGHAEAIRTQSRKPSKAHTHQILSLIHI